MKEHDFDYLTFLTGNSNYNKLKIHRKTITFSTPSLMNSLYSPRNAPQKVLIVSWRVMNCFMLFESGLIGGKFIVSLLTASTYWMNEPNAAFYVYIKKTNGKRQLQKHKHALGEHIKNVIVLLLVALEVAPFIFR